MFIAALFTIAKHWEHPDVINERMDKQNALYPSNGLLFSHEKEQSTDTCYNVDEP